MTQTEALRLALTVLDDYVEDPRCKHEIDQAITAIKAALEAKDEPVGKFAKFTDGIWREVTDGSAGVPLYATSTQRTWVGLTADEMESLYQQATYMDDTDHIHMLMMAEAKLKEKNT
jgi:hypothetical protein